MRSTRCCARESDARDLILDMGFEHGEGGEQPTRSGEPPSGFADWRR
jgi:hypothetical protein